MNPRAARAATAGLLVAVLLAWVNGILVRTLTADVPFSSDTAEPSDYRVAAGAGLVTALLLLLALLAAHSLHLPAWLSYLTAAGVATQLALGATAWWASRSDEGVVPLTRSVWDGVAGVFELPGSWPLLVVLVGVAVVAVRGRSSRAPR